MVYRASPAAATRAYESADSTEVEDVDDGDAAAWSREVPFSFRCAVQGVATAQGPVFGGGDQFHVSAVGDTHLVATLSLREGLFSSWQIYTFHSEP